MNWTVAIGVDTHRDRHTACALSDLGVVLGQVEVPTTRSGYRELIEWARGLGEPAFAVEGTASYGAGLLATLVAAGETVYEVERPERAERRAGKSDPIDAELAAAKLLAGKGLSVPRGGGRREELRVLLAERNGAQQACTAALNQLQALVVTTAPELREQLRSRNGRQLTRRLLSTHDLDSSITVTALQRIARRVEHLTQEIEQIDEQLDTITHELAPELLAEHGIGTITLSQLIVSSGDPRRLRNQDASLARLAGTCPIPASSGNTNRHRLNRGGDRQLNKAIHIVALTRIRSHQETRTYYQHLQQNGKSKREAIRCVKRALTRRLYRLLAANPNLHFADA